MSSTVLTVLGLSFAISVVVILVLCTPGSRLAARVFAFLGLCFALAAGAYVIVISWTGGVALLFAAVPTLLSLTVLLTAISPDKPSVLAFVAGTILICGTYVLLFTAGYFYIPAALAVAASLACWPHKPLSEWR